jgi:hypothetical protein
MSNINNIRRKRYVVMAARYGFNAERVSAHRSLNAACKSLASVVRGKGRVRDLQAAYIFDKAGVHGELSLAAARALLQQRTETEA